MLKINPGGRPKKEGPLVKITSVAIPEDTLAEMHKAAEFLGLNFSKSVCFYYNFWKDAIKRKIP